MQLVCGEKKTQTVKGFRGLKSSEFDCDSLLNVKHKRNAGFSYAKSDRYHLHN